MADPDDKLARRLEAIGDFIADIAGGDFTARFAVSDARDEVDAVGVSLNLLAEDFAGERRRRELAEERLRDAVEGYESAPEMFCSVDLSSGVIVQCNRTMTEALGWARDDLVGRPLAALYPPASQELMPWHPRSRRRPRRSRWDAGATRRCSWSKTTRGCANSWRARCV